MGWIAIVILAVALVVALCLLYNRQKALKESRKLEDMKIVFLRNINREIRVPLASFSSVAETLGKDDLYLSKNDKRNMKEQLLYNANLIGTLLDEVMMFTEAEESGHQMQMESFSPNLLCRRCLQANMNSIYHRKAVKLKFQRELNDEFFVKSDRHLVELIVSKLIVNACRFTEQGEIQVGCNTTEHREFLTVYVNDTGDGIPEGRQSSLFSYFEKPDDLQDEAELDLSICGKLAEKLGGALLYDDSYQGGTRMKLLLPMH
ncbi:MAG: HAMP domain-containing histidine kinase [Prevotella sp.]|jgi:signal transduction histidine kinase|nr:HAMP domain-containing histidine kinase [Prevotella sp.]